MEILRRRNRPNFWLRLVGYAPLGIRRRLLHLVALRSWPRVRSPRSYADVATSLLLADHDLPTLIAGDKDAAKTYVRGLSGDVRTPLSRWLGKDADSIPEASLSGLWVAKLNAGSGAAVLGRGPEDLAGLKSFIGSWVSDEAAEIFGSTYYRQARQGIIIE